MDLRARPPSGDGPGFVSSSGDSHGHEGRTKQAAVLEASRSIILESGIGKLSHGAIAEVLDISKSAIHWHFPTKDDLLKALIDDYLEHLQAEEKRHETPFIASGLSPEDAVLPAMRLWYLDFRENRAGWVGLGSQLLSLSSRHPALVEPIRAWYKSLYDRIGRSSADTVRGYVAMMVFDGFFNSSKMGRHDAFGRGDGRHADARAARGLCGPPRHA